MFQVMFFKISFIVKKIKVVTLGIVCLIDLTIRTGSYVRFLNMDPVLD
jgi:hypothetical protein